MLLPVKDALNRILSQSRTTDIINVNLHEADGYGLAQNVVAKRTQPPFAASAMDGYAVRHEDLASDKSLRVIGEAAAGHQFYGAVGPCETVRIFTGAPMPKGTDTVLIQEDAHREGDTICPQTVPEKGMFVRQAGMDFKEGEMLLMAGTKLDFRSLSLAAAMNHASLLVYKKPVVGIISNGDELVVPGNTPNEDQIIASNAYGVASLVRQNGGVALDLGIAPDNMNALIAAFKKAKQAQCDIVVTLGGASVGDHDFVKDALNEFNILLDFWKIAMRPGKPFMFGSFDNAFMMGLPGNPVSSLICGLLFLKPLLLSMQGLKAENDIKTAVLEAPLPQNGSRQAYLRASVLGENGKYFAKAFEQQDSSILSILSKANGLIIRPANARPAKIGDTCPIMLL